jgi:hypothetical protein
MIKISLKDFDSTEPDDDDAVALAMDLDTVQLQREFASLATGMDNLRKEIELMKESMAHMVTRREIQANFFSPIAGQIMFHELTRRLILTRPVENPTNFMGRMSWGYLQAPAHWPSSIYSPPFDYICEIRQ